MGFLKDAGVTDVVAPDDDYFIANGVYPAVIQDSKLMHPGGDDSKTSWQITYRLDAEVETYGGRYISEFFDMDPNLPDDRKVWIKRRLNSLELTQEEQDALEPQDIIGYDVTVTVKNTPSKTDPDVNYTNVKKVKYGKVSVVSDDYLNNF
jgi:hypothetical protein